MENIGKNQFSPLIGYNLSTGAYFLKCYPNWHKFKKFRNGEVELFEPKEQM